MTTAYTRPPQYDCEIFSDLYKYKGPLNPDYKFCGTSEAVKNEELDCFLVIGLSKGTVIFVRIDNLDYIYARFSLHRQAVTHITEVKQHKTFISVCDEFSMVVWGFAHGREQVYQKFNLYQPIFDIIDVGNQMLLLCFSAGNSEILTFNPDAKKLMKVKFDKTDEHDVSITCCDSIPNLGLIITGDGEGLVKIWNSQK